MRHIDEQSNSLPGEDGQLDGGLSQHNPSPTAEIIRRGK